MIIFTKEQYNSIVAHAKAKAPVEDCGLIGGAIDGENKIVKKVYFLTNLDESAEHFSMDAKEQFDAVKDMRANGLKLLGNFHSHPASPARPSEEDKRLVFDRKLSYLILSLAESEPVFKSFTFDADKNVAQENLVVE